VASEKARTELKPPFTLGVLADTHIPDRRRSLNPLVFELFQETGVASILHAGDVSTPGVLRRLEQIAPVYAVRGNRDWVALRRLPWALRLQFAEVKIGLTHGHGLVWDYLRDRLEYMRRGYRLELFQPRLLAAFPDVDVIVFGHTHRALNHYVDGKLVFNPGSPHFPDLKGDPPSVGLLHIGRDGKVVGEIRALDL